MNAPAWWVDVFLLGWTMQLEADELFEVTLGCIVIERGPEYHYDLAAVLLDFVGVPQDTLETDPVTKELTGFCRQVWEDVIMSAWNRNRTPPVRSLHDKEVANRAWKELVTMRRKKFPHGTTVDPCRN